MTDKDQPPQVDTKNDGTLQGQRLPTYIYAKPMSENSKAGETPIYRCLDALQTDLSSCMDPSIQTVQDCLLDNLKKTPNNKFLGQRMFDKKKGQLEKKYTWHTYKEALEIAENLGSGMLHLEMAPSRQEFENYNLKFVAIYSKNNVNSFLIDVACCLYGITSVPIYDTLGEDATNFMFKQTNTTTCFLTANHIKGVAGLIGTNHITTLENLVIMDPDYNVENDEDLKAIQKDKNIKVYTFADVIKAGSLNKAPHAKVQPDDPYIISYTSGTTGEPKGAMISHKNLISFGSTSSFKKIKGLLKGEVPVHISYLPLAHIFERLLYSMCIALGGKVGLFNGDVTKLKEDLPILKPNIFASVPRLFNKFHDVIKGGMKSKGGCLGKIAKGALETKLANLKKTGTVTHYCYDKLVFKKTRAVLGGNVKFQLTGSAPIDAEVLNFLKVCFCVPFLEGYGQTEGTGCEFAQDPSDSTSGHVGGIMSSNEFKLKDVPEMNYTSKDQDDNGNPGPRGEIQVRGNGVFLGYYKNLEKTQEAVDSEGWLHSGDIATILHPSGAVKIIDRVKNIFKMSQGEYVAPDRLEQSYKTADGIADIFVYGDSFKSNLVAIVCIDHPTLQKMNGGTKTAAEMCQDESLNKIILDELNKITTSAKLKGFERIKKVLLIESLFTDLGLTTPTFKLKRNEAKMHFQKELDELYVGLD